MIFVRHIHRYSAESREALSGKPKLSFYVYNEDGRLVQEDLTVQDIQHVLLQTTQQKDRILLICISVKMCSGNLDFTIDKIKSKAIDKLRGPMARGPQCGLTFPGTLGIPGGPVKKKIDKHLFDSNGPYY
jgi:hypothetical protein